MKRFLFILILILSSFASFSQITCPNDSCESAADIYAPYLLETNTICYKGVNGYLPTGTIACSAEPESLYPFSGGIFFCWSPNYDFWWRLNVTHEYMSGFHFDLTSNYAQAGETSSDGIQIAIYPTDQCEDFVAPIYTSDCNFSADPVSQEWHFDLDLEIGIYMIQVDGFANSIGSCELCITGLAEPESPLETYVPPQVYCCTEDGGFYIVKDGKKYDLLGRYIGDVEE